MGALALTQAAVVGALALTQAVVMWESAVEVMSPSPPLGVTNLLGREMTLRRPTMTARLMSL